MRITDADAVVGTGVVGVERRDLAKILMLWLVRAMSKKLGLSLSLRMRSKVSDMVRVVLRRMIINGPRVDVVIARVGHSKTGQNLLMTNVRALSPILQSTPACPSALAQLSRQDHGSLGIW